MTDLEVMHDRDRLIDAVVEAVTEEVKLALAGIVREARLPGAEELVAEWIYQLTPRRPSS